MANGNVVSFSFTGMHHNLTPLHYISTSINFQRQSKSKLTFYFRIQKATDGALKSFREANKEKQAIIFNLQIHASTVKVRLGLTSYKTVEVTDRKRKKSPKKMQRTPA